MSPWGGSRIDQEIQKPVRGAEAPPETNQELGILMRSSPSPHRAPWEERALAHAPQSLRHTNRRGPAHIPQRTAVVWVTELDIDLAPLFLVAE